MGLPGPTGKTNPAGTNYWVTGNRWCEPLKYRIWDFRDRLEKLIQRTQITGLPGIGGVNPLRIGFGISPSSTVDLNLDRTKMAKPFDDKLSRAVEREYSFAVDLAKRELERKTSECYKGFAVTSRLKRVPNEAVKCNALAREE